MKSKNMAMIYYNVEKISLCIQMFLNKIDDYIFFYYLSINQPYFFKNFIISSPLKVPLDAGSHVGSVKPNHLT